MSLIFVQAYRVLVSDSNGNHVPTNVGRPWSNVARMLKDTLSEIIMDDLETVPAIISSVLESTGEFNDLSVIQDLTDRINAEYVSDEVYECDNTHSDYSMIAPKKVAAYGFSLTEKENPDSGIIDDIVSINIAIVFQEMRIPSGDTEFRWYVPLRIYAFPTEVITGDKKMNMIYKDDKYDFLGISNKIIDMIRANMPVIENIELDPEMVVDIEPAQEDINE